MKINGLFITSVRSILAISSLTVLLFTPINDLFPIFQLERIKENSIDLDVLNIFVIFEKLYIPYFLSIIVFVLIILGIYPRITCIFHTIVAYSIFHSSLIIEGGDQINAILTLLIMPICLLDKRTNGWRKEYIYIKDKHLRYFVYLLILLIQLQMSILYLNAGISKLFQSEWANGTAVYYWFNAPIFGAPDWIKNLLGFLFKNRYSLSVINYSVILLEIFLSFSFLLKQKTKYLLFFIAILFHFTIAAIHGLPSFSISMTAGLILLLFDYNLNLKDNILECKNSLFSVKNLIFSEIHIK